MPRHVASHLALTQKSPQPDASALAEASQKDSPQAQPTRFVWLSGLRAFGLILVLIYHFFPAILPAGFIGVDVFFVFSGYLITSLVIKEFLDTGRIRLMAFYRRRVRRLLPALVFMLLIVIPLTLLLASDFRAQLPLQTAATLGWVTNFYEIVNGQSYANNIMPHLFVHTWTLGIEMQYYLIWGALLTVAVPALVITRSNGRQSIVRSVRVLAGAAIALAVVSYVCMQLLRMDGADPSMAYFSTLSHIYPLFTGSLMGLLAGYPHSPLVHRFKRIAPKVAIILVVACLAVITAVAVFLSFTDPLIYWLGLPLTSLCSALVIALGRGAQERLSTHPEPRILTYLADRSYSLYLFHWPLYIIFTRVAVGCALQGGIDATAAEWAGTAAALVLTFVCAHISYRFVEKPFSASGRRASAGTAPEKTESRLPAFRPSVFPENRPPAFSRIAGSIIGLVLGVCSLGVLITAPAQTSVEQDYRASRMQIDVSQVRQAHKVFSALTLEAILPGGSAAHGGNGAFSSESTVTFIGDSVAFVPAVILQEKINVKVDVEVGRGMRAGVDIVQSLNAGEQLGEYVIIALATNSHADSYDAAVDIINSIGRGHRIIFVTAHGVYNPEMQALSAQLRTLSDQYPFVTIADWDSAIAGKEDQLAADGYHCGTEESIELYVQVILDSLRTAAGRAVTK